MSINSFGIEDKVVERTFVVALLNKYEASNRVSMILPFEAVIDPNNQAMYFVLVSLSSQGIKFEYTAVCNELLKVGLYDDAGGPEGVQSYFDEKTEADPIVLAKILQDLHSRRLEINLADIIQARAYDRSGGDDNAIAARLSGIHQSLVEMQQLMFDDDRVLTSAEFSDYYNSLLANRAADVGKPKLTFKWADANKLTPSLVAGDMVIIVAEPGVGKTSILETEGEYLWQEGFHGVFYHLELSMDRMADRRVARQTGLPIRVLQDGRSGAGEGVYLQPEDQQKINESIETMGEWPGGLALKHCPGWTMTQIVSDMRLRAEAGPLDFVIVDYFNKIQVPSRSNSYTTYDINLSIEMFKTALEDLGIVGFMAAQFPKRSGNSKKDNRRTVGDAKDTGALEEKCQVGIVINRPIDDATGERTDQAVFRVTKCNAGSEGQVSLLFDGPRFTFHSMTLVHQADDFDDFSDWE